MHGQFKKAVLKTLYVIWSETTPFFRSVLGSTTWNAILTLIQTIQEAQDKSLWCWELFTSFHNQPICFFGGKLLKAGIIDTLTGASDKWLMQPETTQGALCGPTV